MAIALGYIIEDCVFEVWTVILILALIRNLWYERTSMDGSSKGHIIRNTNRSSIVILVLVVVLSPDFRAIGIYSNNSIIYNLIYDFIAISILFTSCSFIYFTLQSASIATAQTMNSSSHTDGHTAPISTHTSHVAYWILPIIAVGVAVPTCVLSNVYGTDLYTAVWQIMLALLVVIEIFVYLYLSLQLQRALVELSATTQHTAWYLALHRRLRVYQIVLTIPACVLVVALLSFVPENITTTRRTKRTEDKYNFTWAVWMWCGLALESGFMYVAWVLPGHQSTNQRVSVDNNTHTNTTSRPPRLSPTQHTISLTPGSRTSLRLDESSQQAAATLSLVSPQETSSNASADAAAVNGFEMVAVSRSQSEEAGFGSSAVRSHVSINIHPASAFPTARSESQTIRPSDEED